MSGLCTLFYLGALTGYSSPDWLTRLSINFPLLSTGATYKLIVRDKVLRSLSALSLHAYAWLCEALGLTLARLHALALEALATSRVSACKTMARPALDVGCTDGRPSCRMQPRLLPRREGAWASCASYQSLSWACGGGVAALCFHELGRRASGWHVARGHRGAGPLAGTR